MQVLSTTQPAGEQLSIVGNPNFATVAVPGASASGVQQITSGANPGNGLATFTLNGAALTPTASGQYLCTVEVIASTVASSSLTMEILLDGVAQSIGGNGATTVTIQTTIATTLSFNWQALITASLGAAHTWSARMSTGSTFNAGASIKLVLIELG